MPRKKNNNLSVKIIFVFLALSVAVLMSGFVVQAQLLGNEAKFWQQVASYYYQQSQK